MKRLKKIYWGIQSLLLVLPVAASAQLTAPDRGSTNLPDLTGSQGLKGLLMSIINIALLFAGLIAVLFLIIGGYRYIVSAGNEEAAEKAKKTIQNAIIGLVVIILSYTLVTVIFRSLSGYSV